MNQKTLFINQRGDIMLQIMLFINQKPIVSLQTQVRLVHLGLVMKKWHQR